MAGLTETGLEIRTQAELQTLLENAVTDAIPGIDLSQGPEHQIIGILAEELAIAWEAIQALYAGLYPDTASGTALDQVAALTGTTRRAPTSSRVTGTVTLAAFTTLPAGSVAAVNGDPDSQFQTTAAVENATAIETTVDVDLEAIETGPVAAPSGMLTLIVTPVTGWSAITNADAATLGEVVATDAELRTQRVTELAGAGSGTYAALRAQVARVDGVEEVNVYGNETLSTDADGRPGKSFEVVVWDGSPAAAADDAIAQAIWDHKPAGISAHGSVDGTATDADTAEAKTIEFTRATQLRVYVVLEVVLKTGTGVGWGDEVIAAIVARALEYTVGAKSYASHLSCAVLDDVPGVEAVTSITLGIAPAPVGASVTADYDEIVRVATADVTVTEAA
jgi:uncharacterized phage protein gp47/JayE